MDNEALNRVILDGNNRQFWIVLWGYPEHSPDEGVQIFDEPTYDEGLTRNIPGMQVGDILFVHRIKISKIIYVSEVIQPPRPSTAVECEREAWRKRWTWSVAGKNLTPTYGRHWRECGEKTFGLCKQFNALHPENAVKLDRINFGSYVKIRRPFAEFLLDHILRLDAEKVRKEEPFRLRQSSNLGSASDRSRSTDTITAAPQIRIRKAAELAPGRRTAHARRRRLFHIPSLPNGVGSSSGW